MTFLNDLKDALDNEYFLSDDEVNRVMRIVEKTLGVSGL